MTQQVHPMTYQRARIAPATDRLRYPPMQSSRTVQLASLSSLIPVHTGSRVPMQRQIYQGLRQGIVSRQLPGGTRLPSSRELAHQLQLSRMPVMQAYQQLVLEGYLDGRRGSGTYVTHTLPDTLLAMVPASPPAEELHRTRLAPHQRTPGDGSLACCDAIELASGRAFRLGPALDAFPQRLWQRLVIHRFRQSGAELFDYQHPAGYPPLREAIASYLGVARGVICTPEQVIVTSGSQHGLDLIARSLLQPGETVWMEDPGYFGAKWAFQCAGLHLLPVPVDAAGLDVAAAEQLAPQARLAYVTPSHQFPLGTTLSLERRLALLAWAKASHSWIVEDDYDSEYRYEGRPLPALQGLDDAGRVLYLGTFSKVLFPSLRLGYLVGPVELVRRVVAARRSADLHSSALEQAVVADFMREGHLARHVRRMRLLYAQRQRVLQEALSQHLGGYLEVSPDPAGMHLVAWLPPEMDGEQIAKRAREQDLWVAALSEWSLRPLGRDALVLGYGALNPEQIRQGVERLCAIVDRSRMPHFSGPWVSGNGFMRAVCFK